MMEYFSQYFNNEAQAKNNFKIYLFPQVSHYNEPFIDKNHAKQEIKYEFIK